MMNILHFSQSVKWSSWFICSLLLHGLIFLAFIWRFSEVQPALLQIVGGDKLIIPFC